MSALDKVVEAAKSYLSPGEQIQTSLLAASSPSTNDHAVIVTDKRIMLFELTFTGRIKAHLSDLDRNTALGPFDGGMWSELENFPSPLWVSWYFKYEVDLADSKLPQGSQPPEKRVESSNHNARLTRKIKRTRDAADWLTVDGEIGLILVVATFVFTHPVKLYRLIRLSFKSAGTHNWDRAIGALGINFLGWLLVIGVGYLAVKLFIWSH
jgi:hypothetical protein